MKKIVLFATALLGFSQLQALPVGNPSEPSCFYNKDCERQWYCDACGQYLVFDFFNFRLGYYGDFVFNRHLETVAGRQIDYSRISTNAAYLAVNFLETFEVFSSLGASKLSFNTSFGPFNATNPGPKFDFETSTSFSWSVGARGTIWEWGCLSWGFEGQYFACNPPVKRMFLRTNVDEYPGESSRRKYSEWQVGSGFSYRYNDYFIPYIAAKYSSAFWAFHNQFFNLTNSASSAIIPNCRSSNHWGYAVGVTFAPFHCNNIAVTAEGRFGDETAFYINAQMQY